MYDLHKLGWHSFQRLCLSISREILGQTVESFLDSNDGGRDGAFSGTWVDSNHEALSGQFVIQCKFTSKADHRIRMPDIRDELDKVKRLVSKGLCDSYILMTNAGVSGKRNEEIKKQLTVAGVRHAVVWDSTWIEQQIQDSPRLRTLVPRVYGIGDLGQILNERQYEQTRAVLDFMQDDLAKVVVTDAYQKAIDAITEHGFVLLIGEPAAGKTTIASLLSLAAFNEWNSFVLKLSVPEAVEAHWDPNEASQFFWVDDAFGVTQYEESLARGWNRAFPKVSTMLSRGTKIVMTSRDYIYNSARPDLKGSAFPLLKESKVVVDVHELALEERRQILYNHLKLGRQPKSFRTNIKPFLEGVASHPSFVPETARRLSDPIFTKRLQIDELQISRFVDRREQFLKELLENLDTDSKAALALIYMRNGLLESVISLQASERDALQRLGSDVGRVIKSLDNLKGSLVQHNSTRDGSAWQFRHPTIGDAYATILLDSPDLMDIFVRGSTPDMLLRQVSCGNVGIENAIVIPKSLYELIPNPPKG